MIEDEIGQRSDHTVNQNDITNSEIDENEILAAKKRLEFAFDQESNDR